MATKKTTTKKAPARKATAKKAAPKKAAAAKRTKAAKAKPAKGDSKPKRLSALDAAAQVLSGTKGAMNCQELIETLSAKKLWTSPGGKTPHATLYSALLREINTKGKDARFKKAERGKFAANA